MQETPPSATDSPPMRAPATLAVAVSGLSKTFGTTRALVDVDLGLAWGETLAVLGHNGAGKSTLLRIIASLVRPDGGTVAVGGFGRATDAAAARSLVGYVAHQPLLYDDLSAEENLAFYARLYGVRDARARIGEVLDDLGVSAWAQRRVRGLSNGMQKRVAIARALLHRPSVLLLDEPETGLDPNGLAMLDRLVRSVTDGGAAVVMTTHGMERGLGLADQVVVLTGGRVALGGRTADVAPADIRAVLTRQDYRGAP